VLKTFAQSTSSLVVMQASCQTNIGEINTINLPDNSKIVLNTNSFVQVKYSQNSRVIGLLCGEIHIDVAHDTTTRPLSVIVDGKPVMIVTAIIFAISAFVSGVSDSSIEFIFYRLIGA
jgi:transmembrane sensor